MFHSGRAKQTARKSTGGSVGTYSMAGQRREDNDEDLEDQDEDELDQEVLLAAVFALFLCSTVLDTVQSVWHATMLAQPATPVQLTSPTWDPVCFVCSKPKFPSRCNENP